MQWMLRVYAKQMRNDEDLSDVEHGCDVDKVDEVDVDDVVDVEDMEGVCNVDE